MGSMRGRLRRLLREAEGEMMPVVCQECGEEAKIRHGIVFDLTCLAWQMAQEGTDEPPADTPPDVRWVYDHQRRCDPLRLVDRAGVSAFGTKWAESARAMRAREERGA
jgi:hypothetical protein